MPALLFLPVGRAAVPALLFLSVGRAAVPAFRAARPEPLLCRAARNSTLTPTLSQRARGQKSCAARPEPLSHTSPQWKLLPSLPSSARPGKEMTWARLFQWGGPPCPPFGPPGPNLCCAARPETAPSPPPSPKGRGGKKAAPQPRTSVAHQPAMEAAPFPTLLRARGEGEDGGGGRGPSSESACRYILRFSVGVRRGA